MTQPFYAWDDAEPKDAMTAAPQDDREAFEKWADVQGFRLEQFNGTRYINETTDAAWDAWSAARAPLLERLAAAEALLKLIRDEIDPNEDFACNIERIDAFLKT